MIKILETKTKEDFEQAILLRRRVLVSEKNYSILDSEPDKDDPKCVLLVAKDGDKVVGTLRIKKERDCHRIQRMAIEKKYRNKKIGTKLILYALKKYKDDKFYLMSPNASIAFYEKFGFTKTKITQKGKNHIYYRLQNYSK